MKVAGLQAPALALYGKSKGVAAQSAVGGKKMHALPTTATDTPPGINTNHHASPCITMCIYNNTISYYIHAGCLPL